MRIDAHQHFWIYDPTKHSWMDESMKAIQNNFLPEDLKILMDENQIGGCVAVQADQTDSETDFLCNLADNNDFIKGVVGWINLIDTNISYKLSALSTNKKLKGFRHVLQSEKQRDFMLLPAFKNGLRNLQNHQFTYDILIYCDQIGFATQLVEEFPHQPFVLDHIAKPNIKSGEIEEWSQSIRALSKFENVYCKISGMVTEANWSNWKQDDFIPYIDTIVECFGADRIMFGSDWPVCNVAANYRQVLNIVENYFTSFTTSEKEKIFGGNAIRFYKLNIQE